MNKEILLNLLSTKELRSFAEETIPAFLDLWAGERALRKALSRAASARIKKFLNDGKARSLSDLFSDPLFTRDFLAEAAPFIKGLIKNATDLLSALSKLPPQAQVEILSRFLEATDHENAGSPITDVARLLNRLHAAEPTFFSEKLSAALRGLVTHTDFGEIRELVDGSRSDVFSIMSALLDELFAYPGKVLLLLSFIPDAWAATLALLKGFLSRINEMPPDLLCDTVASYLESVDPAEVYDLINQVSELARKLHTGSRLLGEVGAPRLPAVFSRFLDRLYQGIDEGGFSKAASAGIDIRSAWWEAKISALSRDPGLKASLAASKAQAFASRMKTLAASFAADADIGPGEQEAFSHAVLTAVDLRCAAEALNAAVRRMLLFWDKRPELCGKILAEGIDAIDETSLLQLTERIMDAAGPSLTEKLTPVLELIGKRLVRVDDHRGRTYSGPGDGEEEA